MAVEQVARWPWNAWPDESGLGGRMAWNPHTTQGGNFWTLITPETWKVLHAVLQQAELERARQASVDTMLGQLRLREAVLLYVGRDVDSFEQQIAENFGSDVARAVSNSLFVLDNVPVPKTPWR